MTLIAPSTVAEISVVYINPQPPSERPQINSSTDAYRYLRQGFTSETIQLREEFLALYMNRGNQVLGLFKVGVGSQTGVVACPRLVITVALKIAAVSIIVAHNHPSGTMRPSRQDELLTEKLREGCKFMDLRLQDHLIISPCGEQYFSFADEGLL